jgi:hypothetical protein
VYAAAEKTRDHLVKAGLVNYQLKAYPGLGGLVGRKQQGFQLLS